MASIDIRAQNLGGSLKILFVDNTDLTRNKRFSFLTEDIVTSGTTFRIQSIVGFEQLTTSSGQIVLIGEIGQERSEILRTSSTIGPSAAYKEVSLLDSLNFDHPQDTKVSILDWNRIEFDYSPTATGAKTTIVQYPVSIQADQKETVFRDTTESLNRIGQANVFYFARFNSSLTDNRNSDWSDPVWTSGYDDNSVFAIKKRALDNVGQEIDGVLITHEFLNEALWEARREYHEAPGRRPFRRVYNKIIGTALTGSYRIDLPTDVEDPFSGQNIYNVRIGANQDMTYYDKKSWDFDYLNKPHSNLVLPYTTGVSTSLWIANGGDFTQSGVISIEGTNLSYTKVTGSQNSLTITVHGSYSTSAGSDVWQNITYDLPTKFTVFADPSGSAYIYFNTPISTAYVNQNIYADYYRTLVGFSSDANILDEPQYDMFVPWLAYRIKGRITKGGIPVVYRRSGPPVIADADYQSWVTKRDQALAQEYGGTEIRISPDIGHLRLPQ